MRCKRSLISIALATLMLVSLCAVCASTSVSSADGGSSRASVQPSDGLVGASIVGAPAVCSQHANSLDLFVRGANGSLYWKHSNDGTTWPSTWTCLGGKLTSDPAATWGGGGVIFVFARGGDGALWSRYTTNGGIIWYPWWRIGGQLLAGTGPAAYTWGNARTGWFVTGTNHALYHMWWDFTGYHGWENLGGYLTSSPAATSPGNGPIDVFARGGDGALWEKFTPDGDFYLARWSSWGGQIAPGTGPAACSWGPDRIDVFVTGTSGALWHLATGVKWGNLGGYLTSSPAAASPAQRTIYVFGRGGDGNIWSKWGYISPSPFPPIWSDWKSIGGM